MEKEIRAELQESVELGRMISEMVNTPGWKHLMGKFAATRDAEQQKLLYAKTIDEVYKAQGLITAMNTIVGDAKYGIESEPERFIREGSEAAKELKTVKDKE